MKRYNPKEIEPKWQKVWADNQTFHVIEDSDKPKKYIIDMFPYPSGAAMHVGHVRNFTISDVLSQYHRQKGYNVMHTMGWDTFGLPAENYAIKTGTPPAETTKANIANFKQQLQRLGMSYDWSREINTTDPDYYRWTQWIFTKLFENGLAYQKESAQWWCPVDKTVLANEQVENGKCWRCGNEVIKKNLKQWFFKITEYADQLLDDIDDLDWPEKIKTMQRNWIGKSKGAEVNFQINGKENSVKVFTTRPDTLFGATFMVLAPEHPLVKEIATEERKVEIENYIKSAQKKTEVERQENKEKTGVFTGTYAVNPVNGEKIPVWVADYVLMGYGTGAIMAVPGHDERDHEFAEKFDLPIVEVVRKPDGFEGCFTGEGEVINSGKYNGTSSADMRDKVVADLAAESLAEEKINYKIRDWLISRQRYWGAPIPIIHCANCIHSEEYSSSTEIEFKDSANFQELFTGRKTSITRAKDDKITPEFSEVKKGNVVCLVNSENNQKVFAKITDLKTLSNVDELYADKKTLLTAFGKNFSSKQDLIDQYEENRPGYTEKINSNGLFVWDIEVITKAVVVPEDQLPVELPEVESYEPTGEGSVLASVGEWVNTACPKCGGPAKRETDTMDGYACSSWYFLRYTDPKNDKQAWDPAKANHWLPIDYYCGGDHAVSHLLYSRFWMHFFADQGWIEKTRREPVGKLVYNGYILAEDGTKMSKSKGNVVNPDDMIDQGYGADSVRVFEMFIAPYEQNTNWNTNGVPGAYRFLNRLWVLVQDHVEHEDNNLSTKSVSLQQVTHKATKKVSQDLDRLSFNTAVATLMETVNSLYKIKDEIPIGTPIWHHSLARMVQLTAPFAPHISEELWADLGGEGSVHVNQWPIHDDKYLVSDTLIIVIQVNGKVRANIQVPAEASKAETVKAAQADENVKTHIEKGIKKTIYVPGKLVNFVV